MQIIVYILRIYKLKQHLSMNMKVDDCFSLVFNQTVFELFSLGKEMKDLVPLMNRTNPNKCQAKKRSRDSNEKKMVKKKPGCEGPPPLV